MCVSEKGIELNSVNLGVPQSSMKGFCREEVTIPECVEPLDMISMCMRQECGQDIQVTPAPKVDCDAAAPVHRYDHAINHLIDTLVQSASRNIRWELCMKVPELQARRMPFG